MRKTGRDSGGLEVRPVTDLRPVAPVENVGAGSAPGGPLGQPGGVGVPGQGSEKTGAAVAAAVDKVAACEGKVLVAQAILDEALDAAPVVSPREAAAVAAVAAARSAAEDAAQVVAERQRKVADADGDLEAAEAAMEDITSRAKTATPGQEVAARVAIEKRERAAAAARDRLAVAQEDQGDAEVRLTGAEEELDRVRALPAVESAAVVRARVGLADALRAVDAARDALTRAQRADMAQRAVEATQTLGATGPMGERVPEYASLDAWVEGFLLPHWRHFNGPGGRWCAQWWKHPEVMSRLAAVWEAWEVLRLEPAPAMSTWWRDHLDPHMRALSDENGAFAGCRATASEQYHQQEPVWPAATARAWAMETNPASPQQPTRILAAQAAAAGQDKDEHEHGEQKEA